MADSANCFLNLNKFYTDFVYNSTHPAYSTAIAQAGLSEDPKSGSVRSKQQRTVNPSTDAHTIQSRVLSQPKTEQDLQLQNNFNGSFDQIMIDPNKFENVHQHHHRSQSGDVAFLTLRPNAIERMPQINNSTYFSPQGSHQSTMRNHLEQSQFRNHVNIHHQSSVPNFQVSSPNLTRHSISVDGVTYPLRYQQIYSENVQPSFTGNESFPERNLNDIRMRYSESYPSEAYSADFFRPNISPPVFVPISERQLLDNYPNKVSQQLYHQRNHPQRSRVNSDDLCHRQYNNIDNYLYQQEASLSRLQGAIDNALANEEQIQEDVRNLEIQVNSLSAVQSNPTESEYKKLQGENDKLRNQLLIMIQDLDNLGVSIPSFNPEPHFPTSSPSKFNPQSEKKSSSNLREIVIPNNPRRNNGDYLNHSSNLSSLPPSYHTVNDPLPLYENVVHSPKVLKTSNSCPPIPPRVPNESAQSIEFQGENWKCPQCTFENLAILKCEICDCNRPLTLRHC